MNEEDTWPGQSCQVSSSFMRPLLYQAYCMLTWFVSVILVALMTAREKSSPQVRQKSPLSLWERPPIAVNCTSAGFPHHSHRLPRGAESMETGLRNSL